MKLTLLVTSILATAASLNGATITFATQPTTNSPIAPVVDSASGLLVDGAGFVAIGATTLSDLQVGQIGASPANFSTFVTSFSQFGLSTTFGGAGAFGEPSLFSSIASNPTATGDSFVNRAITLVAGNGTRLDNSTQLFVYNFNVNYAADAPLFTADVNLTQAGGTVLFGATQIGIALPTAGTNNGFKMGELSVIPEPSAALLGVLGALGLLRRRRI